MHTQNMIRAFMASVIIGSSTVGAQTINTIKRNDPFADMRKDASHMQADKPWHIAVESGLWGVSLGALGYVAAVPSNDGRTVGVSATCAAVVGALIGMVRNNRYHTVYEKNEGRNIFGAAAANDVEGMMAWNKFVWTPASVLSMQKNDCKRGNNLLQIAAANGATGAAELALQWMPVTEEKLKQTTTSTTNSYDSQLDRWVGSVTDGWAGNANRADKTTAEVREVTPTIDKKDGTHRSAAEYAALNGHTETLALLIQRGANIDEILKWAASNAEYKAMLEQATRVFRS